MLYYLKAIQSVEYRSTSNLTATFYYTGEYDLYAARSLHKKIHYWSMYGSEFCLCCPTMKKRWNYNIRWVPAE